VLIQLSFTKHFSPARSALIYAIDPTLRPVFVVALRHPRQPHPRSVRELVQEFRRLSMFSDDARPYPPMSAFGP
jgi:hypothetical protein